MEYADIQNTKEQVNMLVKNLKDKGNFSNFDILQQLRLTLPAIVKYNLTDELNALKPALFAFTQKEKCSHPYNTPLHVYELLVSCRNAFTPDELDEYAKLLSNRFDDDCNTDSNSSRINLHSIMEMGKTLSWLNYKKGQMDKVDSILNKTINCIEKSDTDMPGLRVVGLYQELIRDISNMGRKIVLDRVNAILEKNAPNVRKGMGKIPIHFSIPQDIIDEEFNLIYDGINTDKFLALFALKYVPTNEEIDEYTEQIQKEFDILPHCTQLYFTTSNTLSHVVRPGQEYKEEQDDQLYSTALSYLTIAMHCIIDTGLSRSVLNVDNVMSFIAKSTVLSPRRVSIIEKGVHAFLEYDYVVAMSILIPQIEYMIREFYAKIGYTVTANDTIGTTSDALGTLLNNEDIMVFDKNISRYLRTVLSNRTGWNLRNLYCHGIDDSFSITQADRIFHILLLMATLTQTDDEHIRTES